MIMLILAKIATAKQYGAKILNPHRIIIMR